MGKEISHGTLVASAVGSDIMPIYRTGQAFLDTFVISVDRILDYVYPATSGLTAANDPDFTEILRIVQSGVEKKLTLSQIFGTLEDWQEQVACGNIRRGWSFEDHFNSGLTTNWTMTNGFSVANNDSNSGFMGEARVRLAAATTAYLNWGVAGGSAPKIKAGLGKTVLVFRANLPSWGSNTGKYQIGFGDTSVAADADQANGIYFEHDTDISANWRYCTAAGSVRTKQTSSVAVTAGIQNLKMVINSDWTSVGFFVDGVSLGTITTNIPSTAKLAIIVHAYKRTHTSNVDSHWDLVKGWTLYNTPLTF